MKLGIASLLATALTAGPARAQRLFWEDWENGSAKWSTVNGAALPIDILVDDQSVTCSSKYQRETIKFNGGRAFTKAPLPVKGGTKHCLTAWIRSNTLGYPFIGIHLATISGNLEPEEHWLIGSDMATQNGYGQTVLFVPADNKWHWYAAEFPLEQKAQYLRIKDELWAGTWKDGSSADFDDIQLWEGACPAGPLGAAHVKCVDPANICTPDGMCAECTQQDQKACVFPKPICDVMAGKCTGCTTNAQCMGVKPICDLNSKACRPCANDAECPMNTPVCTVTGACGQCSANNKTACKGNTPVCDVNTGICTGCKSDNDCVGSPNTPACQPNGSCGQCSMTNKSKCVGGTPICDVAAGICIGCKSDADCGATPNTPACQPNGTCGQCSMTNKTQCKGGTPLCDVAKGMCTGCKSDADCVGTPLTPACQANGLCGECSKNNATLCVGQKPACNDTIGKCVLCTLADATACAMNKDGTRCQGDVAGGNNLFCGCNIDADCGGKTSGRVCDAQMKKCIDGCSPALARNNCPLDKFCTSNDLTGQVIGMCTNACVFDADCVKTPETPFCLKDANGARCVNCKTSKDCKVPTPICAPVVQKCVECTPMDKSGCKPELNGAACLQPSGKCGCVTDSDCGGVASGRVCDTMQAKCVPGCRASGGNGCPKGFRCTSKDMTIGVCEPIAPLDIGLMPDLLPGDMAMLPPDLSVEPPGPDLTAAPADHAVAPRPDLAVPTVVFAGGGCGCTLGGGRASSGQESLAVATLALLAGLLLRRRKRA